MNNYQRKQHIAKKIQNGFAETHVGFHSEYRMWQGEWVRGAYAQIAAPYGGTTRIYANSYRELLAIIEES